MIVAKAFVEVFTSVKKSTMKQVLFGLCVLAAGIITGCKKNSANAFDGNLVAYASVAVTKNPGPKVFAHMMPWFETPASNGGYWGVHWTLNYTNPNNYTGSQRNIASYYYPQIAPYASGDTTVIDYQLLSMKLSGIDGVLIDWYGTSTNAGQANYASIRANTLAITSRMGRAGLKYAIVYEDQALGNYDSANTIIWGKADMSYMQANFFSDPNYETVSGHPLLLNFGPQHIVTASMWDSVFSVLPASPSFYILWYGNNNVVPVTAGEFTWVVSTDTAALTIPVQRSLLHIRGSIAIMLQRM
jgi:hypothetical protein